MVYATMPRKHEKQMKILSIETSTPSGFIALFDKKELIFCKTLDQSRRVSHELMGDIQQELLSRNYSLSDIDMFSVGLGPGSFLGTRIGVILAKTLAYGLDVGILGFCSLSLYTPKENCSFYVLSDAKSKGVYALKGTRQSGMVSFEKKPQLYSIEEFLLLQNGETLITAQEDIIEKDPYFRDNLQLVTTDFSLHREEIFSKIKLRKNASNPLEKLDIHYLRMS